MAATWYSQHFLVNTKIQLRKALITLKKMPRLLASIKINLLGRFLICRLIQKILVALMKQSSALIRNPARAALLI
jgi:hypothetical protein